APFPWRVCKRRESRSKEGAGLLAGSVLLDALELSDEIEDADEELEEELPSLDDESLLEELDSSLEEELLDASEELLLASADEDELDSWLEVEELDDEHGPRLSPCARWAGTAERFTLRLFPP